MRIRGIGGGKLDGLEASDPCQSNVVSSVHCICISFASNYVHLRSC